MQSLYERDFTQWLSQQRDLLADKRFNELDLDNLLEALEYEVGNPVSEFENRLTTLITHLLKYDYQQQVLKDPWVDEYVKHTWLDTIAKSRKRIIKLIKNKPSINNLAEKIIKEIYIEAKEDAIEEMNRFSRVKNQKLTDTSFPETCLWSYEQIMTKGWLP